MVHGERDNTSTKDLEAIGISKEVLAKLSQVIQVSLIFLAGIIEAMLTWYLEFLYQGCTYNSSFEVCPTACIFDIGQQENQ